MPEAARIVLGAWIRRWSAWVALLAIAIDAAVQLVLVDAPGRQTAAWVLHGYASAAVGVVWGIHLHLHLLRHGVALVPGLRRLVVRTSLAAVAVAIALPALVATLRGADGLGLLALTPLPLAVGLFTGAATSPNSKAMIAGVSGLFLGLQIPITAVLERRATLPPWAHAALVDHPTTTLVVAAVLGVGLATFVLRGVGGHDEAGWWFRQRTTRRTGAGDACQESMRGMWLLQVLPGFASRRIDRESTAVPLRGSRLVQQWRSTAGPMSPWGLVLLGAPIAVLMTFVLSDDASARTVIYPIVFLTNMLVGVGVNYARGRWRQEWLRPVSREQLFWGLARAFARDYTTYAGATWVILCAALVATDPGLLGRTAEIGPLLAGPAVAFFGGAITLLALRYGRYGGATGFAASAFPAMFLFERLARSGRGEAPLTWVVVTLVFVGLALVALRIARRVWMRAELGRA